jgi:tetratricopeptide (TPR) repeat protein
MPIFRRDAEWRTSGNSANATTLEPFTCDRRLVRYDSQVFETSGGVGNARRGANVKAITCQECSKVSERKASYLVEGRTLCENCAKADFEARHGQGFTSVIRLSDDSLCVRCGTDLDGLEPKAFVDGIICVDCDASLRRRPFPIWLRVAAVFIGTMVIVAYVYNWRFVQAHLEVKRRDRALVARDLDGALKYSARANQLLPEAAKVAEFDRQLRAVDSLRKAATLLGADGKEQEVVKLISESRVYLPDSYQKNAQMILLFAEQALAFDRKDYDQAVAKGEELVRLSPDDAAPFGSLASAQAAKYAVTGDETFKKAALASLEKCKAAPNPRADYPELVARINHRLETREIIKRAEYRKRFPQGWPPSREEGANP